MTINKYISHAERLGYKVYPVFINGFFQVAIEQNGDIVLNKKFFSKSDQDGLKKELLSTHKKKYDETK